MNLLKKMTLINNFISLIDHLNKAKREKKDKINENTKIIDIEIVKNLRNISKEFKELFQEKNQEDQDKENNNNANNNNNNPKVNLNVSKIINIFKYFLELIFKYVKKDIEKHHEKNLKKKGL